MRGLLAARQFIDRLVTNTLLLGYGNVDRQDDGVAWHILAGIAQKLGVQPQESPLEGMELDSDSLKLQFVLQLAPEMAEEIAAYERVCFLDAHTGAVEEEVHFTEIDSQYQASPFTHHMTPETLLAISIALYGRAPQAVLVSVRGYEFGFSDELSTRTAELAQKAVEVVWGWLPEEVRRKARDEFSKRQ